MVLVIIAVSGKLYNTANIQINVKVIIIMKYLELLQLFVNYVKSVKMITFERLPKA